MRKIIVFGASAGGIQGLCTILKALPPDLDAAILAVIHTSQKSEFLPTVLGRCCQFQVVAPNFAEPIRKGHLYVAAPKRHLLVRSHCAVSWMGPRENRHRPSVDALFRSAARAFKSNVIAVVLSGALDDGTAGSLAVKARGGTVIVQDPEEAMVSDMPANVLKEVRTDKSLPLEKIASVLVELVTQGKPIKFKKTTVKQCRDLGDLGFHEFEPSGYSCPECGGALLRVGSGKNAEYRCHVGHAFSLNGFSEAHADALERALWVALRQLNEQYSLQQNLAKDASAHGPLKKRHAENAVAARHDIQLLHEILSHL